MSIVVLLSYTSVYDTWHILRPDEGFISLGTGVKEGCELSCGW